MCVHILEVTEPYSMSGSPSLSHAAFPVIFWMARNQAEGEAERSCTPVMLRLHLHSQAFWKKGNAF